MNVCFKRIKKIAEVSLSNHKKMGNLFCVFSNFIVRQLYCN